MINGRKAVKDCMVIDNRFKRRRHALSSTLRQPGAVNEAQKSLSRSRCWNVMEYKNKKNIGHFYIVKVSPYFIFKADFQAPIYKYHRIYQLIFLKYK